MKILLSTMCTECAIEAHSSLEKLEKLFQTMANKPNIKVEINDDSFYEYICPKGHKNNVQIREQKFEILFDLAVMAFLDGYTREAVSSFASSLERYLEFYIKVVCKKFNISSEYILETWKQVQAQSERQLGAYYFLSLIKNKREPPVVSQKWYDFRNKVIHKGYIPSSNEVKYWGEYIYKYIISSLKELGSDCDEAVIKVINEENNTIWEKYSKKPNIGTLSIPTLLSPRDIKQNNYGDTKFDDAISSIMTNEFYKQFYHK